MCVAGLWFVIIRGSAKLLATIAIIALVCLVLIGFLLPIVSFARPAAYRNWCANNLKQITIALQNYHDVKGVYPPSYISDRSGAPILSWRVPILPYMEENVLYSRIDISKAWNAPSNRATTSIPVDTFQCPSHSSSAPTTHYLAIVGPQTAWPEARGRSLKEITNGPANTILLIETCERVVNWAEPRDLSFEQAVELLSSPIPVNDGHYVGNGFLYKRSGGRHVAFADGHVAFLNSPLDRDLAAALLTVSGGEEIDPSSKEKAMRPQLDYAKCYAFGMFVVLSLLPAAWVTRRGVEDVGDAAQDCEPLARG